MILEKLLSLGLLGSSIFQARILCEAEVSAEGYGSTVEDTEFEVESESKDT